MPVREELEKLREVVRTASGPDREIDVAVLAACFPEWAKAEPPFYAKHCVDDEEPIYFHAPDWLRKRPCPKLSSSIDAALALVERMLPGWETSIVAIFVDEGKTVHEATLARPRWQDYTPFGDWTDAVEGQAHSSRVLAILDALLSALIAASRED